MKTIRPNCFETNSSSTHSLTLNAPTAIGKPSTTFLANEDGFIDVAIEQDPSECESCLHDKLQFMISYAYVTGDQAKFERVKRVVQTFTNIPLRITLTTNDWGTKTIAKEDIVSVEPRMAAVRNSATDEELISAIANNVESYGTFANDYGNGSMKDFIEEAESIFTSDELILTFIFSNHYGFSRTEYYDG